MYPIDLYSTYKSVLTLFIINIQPTLRLVLSQINEKKANYLNNEVIMIGNCVG